MNTITINEWTIEQQADGTFVASNGVDVEQPYQALEFSANLAKLIEWCQSGGNTPEPTTEQGFIDASEKSMNLNKFSKYEMRALLDQGYISIAEILAEQNRRDAISNARWHMRQRDMPAKPNDGIRTGVGYRMVFQRPHYEVYWHNQMKSMKMDDWNRVRIVFWIGKKLYAIGGVSTMHAILIAQVSGMTGVMRPEHDYEKYFTRRERGQIAHLSARGNSG